MNVYISKPVGVDYFPVESKMFPEIDQVTNCTIKSIKDFARIDKDDELYDGFIFELKELMKKYEVNSIEGKIEYSEEHQTIKAHEVNFEGQRELADYAVLVKTNEQKEELMKVNTVE